MSKRRRARTALMLAAALLLAAWSGAGCAAPAGKTDGGAEEPSQTIRVNPPGEFPITQERITLRVFTPQDSYVEDYETNAFTLYYEELTNIHVQWDLVLKSNLSSAVQTRLVAQDLPDVFLKADLSDAAVLYYGSVGTFLPLDSLIETYGARTKSVLERAPYILDSMVAPGGSIYHVPNVGEVLHASMPKKAWIYEPWLHALGLELPRTTKELHAVLQAFKERDPNGNGKPDEIPFAGATGGHNELESYLLQSFLFYDRTNYLSLEEGRVVFSANTPAYREGLRYIHALMAEGLIEPMSFTQDRIALTALAERQPAAVLGGAAAMYWGHFTGDGSARRREYTALPVLKGPDGAAYGYDRGYDTSIGGKVGAFVITKACALPAAAMRWMDELYDQEALLSWEMTPSMGIQGEDWFRDPPGVEGLDGLPASYELVTPYGSRQNHHWSQTVNSFNSYRYRMRGAATDETETRLFQVTAELYKPFAAPEARVPFVFLSEEESARFGDYLTNIDRVVQSYLVRFSTGALDLEADWEEYRRELEQAGVANYVGLIQRAMDHRNRQANPNE